MFELFSDFGQNTSASYQETATIFIKKCVHFETWDEKFGSKLPHCTGNCVIEECVIDSEYCKCMCQ